MEVRENNDAFAELCEALDRITAAVKEIAAKWAEIFEELEKELVEIDYAEREKRKPPLFAPLPPRRYPSVKLWRKNKALFRPYRREWRGNKTPKTKEGKTL